MADPQERFAHGDFWDRYSRRWEEEVRPGIEGEILGDEWTRPERTDFVYERFAAPYLESSPRVVEIGPGGGKFSRRLVEKARELILVDISREMLQRANRSTGGRAREVVIEDGSLEQIEAGSAGLVFSYDVFIHLESEEIFRYFAEVNRVLETGGVFSVHTSSFESRWGLHSYFQQLRDHQPLIGRRYGGRMYPMTEGILRRFAEHSGFAVLDAYADRQDKDLIFALRKTRPARPWAFFTTPALYERYELSERVGGSDRRELYAARSLSAGAPRILAVGDAGDRDLLATGRVEPPPHPCLAAPRGVEMVAGFAIVSYEGQSCRALSRIIAAELGSPGAERPGRPLMAQLGRLFEGLLEAHAAGLVHGELGPEFIVRDGPADQLRLFGLSEPAGSSAEESRRRDLGAMAPIVFSIAKAGDAAEVAAAASELADAPGTELAETLIRLLAK